MKEFDNKYSNNMTIPNKLSKKWETELKGYGMLESCEEMGLSYSVIHRAISTRNCTKKTFDLVNAYLLKKRGEIGESIKEVVEHEQD